MPYDVHRVGIVVLEFNTDDYQSMVLQFPGNCGNTGRAQQPQAKYSEDDEYDRKSN